jgi:hypothetical protein
MCVKFRAYDSPGNIAGTRVKEFTTIDYDHPAFGYDQTTGEFTIQRDGYYTFIWNCVVTNNAGSCFTVNQTSGLNTTVVNLTPTERRGYQYSNAVSGEWDETSFTEYLKAGDVVRPISDTASTTGNGKGAQSITVTGILSNEVVYNPASTQEWTEVSGLTISATTTAPTKASAPLVDKAYYRRDGGDAIIRLAYAHSSAAGAAAGSGEYLFDIEAIVGLPIDTDKIDADSSPGHNGKTNTVGHVQGNSSVESFAGGVIVHDSQYVRFFLVGTSNGSILGSTFNPLTQSNVSYTAEIRVPIKGWSDQAV